MLQIQGVSKQYGSKVLFEDASLFIGTRTRVALIGPNGSGKSTLIRIILGEESTEKGQVSHVSHLAIGHLAQEVPKHSGRTVLGEAMRLDGRREDLLKAKEELETKFASESSQHSKDHAEEHAEDLDRYGRVLEELEHLDEYRLEARAKEILSGMGFKSSDFERSLTEFSGGWLMRVALARVLLMDPDLLLLDEPTNHLDLESLLWLEDFLQKYQGAMLLISHDTEFLNSIVTEVFEIDQKRVVSYKGNLESYAIQKEERLEILRGQYAGQQAKIADIEEFVARFGAKATKARQAQSRLKQLDKMERIELPEHRATVRFRFPPAPHSGKEVITIKDAALSFGPKPLFHDLNWILQRGSRVAIVGVNGAGKTTLLRLLAGEMSPTAGQIKFGHQVQVGYYAQLQAEALDMTKTVYQELEKSAPQAPVTQLRAIAGAFLFSGDAVEKKCGVLSGGEKARVALAKLLLSPANFLILDEPTNHLDIESRGVLLEALQNFDGTLCLVSHDRAFISPLVTSVLEIDPTGTGSRVIPLLGSYEDYLERKVKEMKAEPRVTKVQSSQSNQQAHQKPKSDSKGPPSNNQKRSWERERDKLEAEITVLEKTLAELSETLSDPKIYEDKPTAMATLTQQREVEQSLSQKINRWEELSSLLE